jgi:hypothetical protein
MQRAEEIDERSGVLRHEPPQLDPYVSGEDDGAALASLPAMALPVANKADFECPPEHIEALKADLPEVDRVLMIGWRAAEPHAIELFQALMPSFVLCTVTGRPADTDELMRNLGDVAGKARKVWNRDDGFTSLVTGTRVELDALLRASWD